MESAAAPAPSREGTESESTDLGAPAPAPANDTGAPDAGNGSDSARPEKSDERAVEEAMLRRYALSRDPALRGELVQRFMPLARSLALRYQGTRESVDDLFQVAYLGLVKAVDGFDPRRARSFTTYAVPTILGELRRHFRDRVWNLRLPRSLQERTAKVEEVMAELGDELSRSPTVAEIAERADLGVEEVLEALSAGEARRTLSLDMPRTREEESDPVIETLGSTDLSFDRVEARLAAPEADLDERELLVLRLRFGANKTQYEIGTKLGVSQMQVSRIMRGALRKLLAAVQAEHERPAGAGEPANR